MRILLWLDDKRDPLKVPREVGGVTNYKKEPWYEIMSPIFIENPDTEVKWVHDYQEFVDDIDKNGIPAGVCLDYDLEKGGKKTGFDCCEYLARLCYKQRQKFPKYHLQSANSIPGRPMMQALIDAVNNGEDVETVINSIRNNDYGKHQTKAAEPYDKSLRECVQRFDDILGYIKKNY
jgi:hypothetical protein